MRDLMDQPCFEQPIEDAIGNLTAHPEPVRNLVTGDPRARVLHNFADNAADELSAAGDVATFHRCPLWVKRRQARYLTGRFGRLKLLGV
jgi:hypothetical protein